MKACGKEHKSFECDKLNVDKRFVKESFSPKNFRFRYVRRCSSIPQTPSGDERKRCSTRQMTDLLFNCRALQREMMMKKSAH